MQDDGDEIPKNNLPAEKGFVEGRHLARLLAVVIGQSEEQQQSHGPEEYGDGVADCAVKVLAYFILNRERTTYDIFQVFEIIESEFNRPSLDALVRVEPQYQRPIT